MGPTSHARVFAVARGSTKTLAFEVGSNLREPCNDTVFSRDAGRMKGQGGSCLIKGTF